MIIDSTKIPTDKSVELDYIMEQCRKVKLDVWFLCEDPFRSEVPAKTIEVDPREAAGLWLRSQVGSLLGKPLQISRSEIYADFLKKKGLK